MLVLIFVYFPSAHSAGARVQEMGVGMQLRYAADVIDPPAGGAHVGRQDEIETKGIGDTEPREAYAI